jgi:hypothetical protein
VADHRGAAYRSLPFRVTSGSLSVEFPAVPASQWLSILTGEGGRRGVLQLLPAGQMDALLDALSAGQATVQDVSRITQSAVTEASGYPWWQAEMLISSVVGEDRRVLGGLVLAGVDPERITLAAYCAAVWALLTRNASEESLMKLEAQMMTPPPGVDIDELDEVEDFDAVARSLRATPGARVG